MIKPKIGSPVLYNAGESQLHAATIAFVHDDGRVNIGGFDSRGVPFNEQNVKICGFNEVIGEGECQFAGWKKPDAEIDLESTKNLIEEALESGDAEIIDNSAFNGMHSAPDGIVVDDDNQPEVAGAVINRQLASHQMNQVAQ